VQVVRDSDLVSATKFNFRASTILEAGKPDTSLEVIVGTHIRGHSLETGNRAFAPPFETNPVAPERCAVHQLNLGIDARLPRVRSAKDLLQRLFRGVNIAKHQE